MSATRDFSGVIAAAPTPFSDSGLVDADTFLHHCRWLLDHGCDGINVLGTNGEANSISIKEREGLMNAVSSSDLPMERMMVGTGGCSLDDTISMTKHAMDCGFSGQLILPPFFYKSLKDEGLIEYFSRIVDKLNSESLTVYLYNFPQLTGVPFPLAVVSELFRRFPDTIVGLKDSSGDLEYSKSIVEACPGFDVFPSSEGVLLNSWSDGFAGSISGSLNITSSLAAKVWADTDAADASEIQELAFAVRKVVTSYPLVPTIKFMLSELHQNPAWQRVLPPQVELGTQSKTELLEKLTVSPDGVRCKR